MPKTRTIIHIHSKQTNEDWYYLAFTLIKPDAYKFPISISRIKQKFRQADYFETKGFYFRKSKIIHYTTNKRNPKPIVPK